MSEADLTRATTPTHTTENREDGLRDATRILTTHVGNLPFVDIEKPPGTDEAAVNAAVQEIVRTQVALGVDIINEGEYTKGGDWLAFANERLGGFEERPRAADEKRLTATGKDREEFAAFYAYAESRGSLYYVAGSQIHQKRPKLVCTAPIVYKGQDAVARQIRLLKDNAPGDRELFMTSTAPASLEVYRANEHYASEEEYLFALADGLRDEYKAITDAGITLQVDDAWLPALWDRIGMSMGLDAFRKRCALRIEVLNHALRGIPEEKIRYHMCWGSWHGPHAFDLELAHLVDLLVRVNAGAYLIEGANARHEHEWEVWRDVRLPTGRKLAPGVVTHSTDVIEHPRLVAQRIERYAEVVGRDNVIAGTDCGFGGRTHPQIAWAKLASLVEGAKIASHKLFS